MYTGTIAGAKVEIPDKNNEEGVSIVMNKLGLRAFAAVAIIACVSAGQTRMALAQQQAQGAAAPAPATAQSGNPILTGQPEPPPASPRQPREEIRRLRRRGAGAAAGASLSSPCRSRRRRGSHPYRSTSSRPRTFIRTRPRGWTPATSAATRRARWSRRCGKADGSAPIRRPPHPGATARSTLRATRSSALILTRQPKNTMRP